MMAYRKELANALIENQYLVQEELAEKQRSARIWQEIGHGLVSLPLFQKFSNGQIYIMMPQKVHPLLPRGVNLLQVLTRSLFVLSLLLVPHRRLQ